ncbi:hypothetical protein [Streptomyces albus]|uniref:hypothetical protein n=1 Tax=Streptomyces albus TaxID=1888 RepID=UPI0034537961
MDLSLSVASSGSSPAHVVDELHQRSVAVSNLCVSNQQEIGVHSSPDRFHGCSALPTSVFAEYRLVCRHVRQRRKPVVQVCKPFEQLTRRVSRSFALPLAPRETFSCGLLRSGQFDLGLHGLCHLPTCHGYGDQATGQSPEQ